MVMNTSTRRGRVLRFHTEALPPNTLLITQLEGREAISKPYRFDLELCAIHENLDPTALFAKPAYVAIKRGVVVQGSAKPGVQTVKIHGVLAQFEQGRKGREWIAYRGVLVPRLWNLSLAHGSRIFQEKTVPEIVEAVLKGNGLTSEDYEFRASGRTYPKREYVVQYQESDLDFIQRLCEHEGIFYLFRQEDDREKVVFGDSTAAYTPVVVPTAVPYNPALTVGGEAGGGIDEWLQPECVRKFALQCSVVPKEVVLRDYNWRTPGVDLKASAPVVPHGRGIHYEYGEHYKDSAEGKALAAVRAEEWKCLERVFPGRSDAKTFHAGCTFDLADHYRADFNQSYLLTQVHHQAGQTFEPGSAFVQRAFYSNEFSAIPADLVFRPERTTPKPRVTGTVNARVDAGGSGEYAEIDDQGRYKVQIPFDLSGADGGKASRFIRMAQPYAGSGMGMHFPLHKGTEVILTHVNGDPDRPVIAGSVPNPETGSPVTGGNNAQCVIQTGGNNKLVIDDDVGRVTLSTPTADTSISIGAEASPLGARIKSSANFALRTGIDTLWNIGRDWKAMIDGDVHFHAVNEHKHLKGYKREVIIGAKSEQVFGSKMEVIVGAKTESVGGMKSTTIGGIKHETVVGAIVQFGYAFQFGKISGPKYWQGAAKKEKVTTVDSKDAGAMIKETAPVISLKGAADVDLTSGGSKMVMNPGSIRLTTEVLECKGKAHGVLKAPTLQLFGDNELELHGGKTLVDGGDLTVNAKKIDIKVDGNVIWKASTVGLDADVSVRKTLSVTDKLTVSGTDFEVG